MNNDSELFREKLFAILRSSLDIKESTIDLNKEDVISLVRFGKRQSILPLLYRGVKNMKLNDGIIKTFDYERTKDLQKMILFDHEIQVISSVLNSAQIPFILLKGATLRHLYPDCFMRTCCDIDVLVNENDLIKAVNTIELETDFCKDIDNYHDVSMINSDSHLELHFSIKENMPNIDSLLDRVWEFSFPNLEYNYKMSPEFQIFHVIAHMSYHMVHGGLGIRPFLDLWLLRNKTNYSKDILESFCSQCGILIFFHKCCKLVDAWMNHQPIEQELLVFENYILSGGVFGSSANSMASKMRTHRGSKYLLRRFFMSKALLEVDYPELKNKPYMFLVYQIKRWLRLLNPAVRNKVKREINTIKSIDDKAIESFDDLLVSLGL